MLFLGDEGAAGDGGLQVYACADGINLRAEDGAAVSPPVGQPHCSLVAT
ncbi:hypothetical protein Lpp14_02816, partial [Lacticaseibacillus paracasei subsp. paracasei Lpp14]